MPQYESDGGGVFCAANNNNAITVPLPAIRPNGSVFLLAAFCRLITAAAPTITDYTLLGTWTSGTASGGRIWLYGRIVDGTESAPSVTPVGATGTSGDIFGAGIACYSGVDASGLASVVDNLAASGSATVLYGGTTGGNNVLAQSFVSPGDGSPVAVELSLAKAGAPTDNVVVQIRPDDAGSPSATVLASASMPAASLTASSAPYSFAPSVTLSAGTTYWIVVSRSGARDTVNYAQWYSSSAAYANGVGKLSGAGVWGSPVADMTFRVLVSSIFDGAPTVQDASGTTTCTYPALTIGQADSMVMRLLARFRDAADTFTPTATWDERADRGTTVRTGGQFHMQDKVATASGVQAAVTVAPSNTTAARYLAVSMALKAAAPVAHTRAPADGFAFTDARKLARGKPIADGLALTDARQIAKSKSLAVADDLAFTDATTRSAAWGRSLADGLGLVDQATPSHTPGVGEAPEFARQIKVVL